MLSLCPNHRPSRCIATQEIYQRTSTTITGLMNILMFPSFLSNVVARELNSQPPHPCYLKNRPFPRVFTKDEKISGGSHSLGEATFSTFIDHIGFTSIYRHTDCSTFDIPFISSSRHNPKEVLHCQRRSNFRAISSRQRLGEDTASITLWNPAPHRSYQPP